MNKNYSVEQVFICPFEINDDSYEPKVGDYQFRWCVIDELKKIAGDIEHELKYNYIKTLNNRNFVDESYNLIEKDKRAAIFPVKNFDIPEDIFRKANMIITYLKLERDYRDGNEVYDNEKYLSIINGKSPKSKVKSKKK